jgi:hypothetical protein
MRAQAHALLPKKGALNLRTGLRVLLAKHHSIFAQLDFIAISIL